MRKRYLGVDRMQPLESLSALGALLVDGSLCKRSADGQRMRGRSGVGGARLRYWKTSDCSAATSAFWGPTRRKPRRMMQDGPSLTRSCPGGVSHGQN